MADEKKGLLGGLLGGKKDDKEDEAARTADMEQTKKEAKEKIAQMQQDAARREQEEKQKMAQQQTKENVEEARKRVAAAIEKRREEQVNIIAEHELGYDEALSTLALKYYGHATPTYYEWIYEHNKDVIGDGGPNATKPGMVIKIPELPDELKDK